MDTKRIPILIFLVVVVMFGLVLVLRNSQLNSSNAPSTTAPVAQGPVLSPTPQKTLLGSFAIKMSNPQTVVKVGQNVSFDLVLDTAGVGIVGYDVLIGVDKIDFDLVSVTSADPNFTIYKRAHSDYLTLTGAEKLSSKNSVVFTNQKVVTLVLRPKKAGKLDLSIEATQGKETSDFVDGKTKIYYPSVSEIKVTVE